MATRRLTDGLGAWLVPIAVAACLPLIASGNALADTIHVPDDYPTIQAAINAAVDGDEIIVHPGTYLEQIDFLGRAIWLHSSDGPDLTTIDANETGSVVSCVSGEGPATVLEGFTITGGTGTLFSAEPCGGGMFITDSFPTVINCFFKDNSAVDGEGGGIYAFGPYSSSGGATIIDCLFTGNSAYDGSGGGICNSHCDTTITNCTFTDNSACEGEGGGVCIAGVSKVGVTGCAFAGNTALYGVGGGMAITSASSEGQVMVKDCVFADNTARKGGGMYNHCDATVTDCLFVENIVNEERGAGDGGALYHDGPFAALECTDCLFVRNAVPHGETGGGAYIL